MLRTIMLGRRIVWCCPEGRLTMVALLSLWEPEPTSPERCETVRLALNVIWLRDFGATQHEQLQRFRLIALTNV